MEEETKESKTNKKCNFKTRNGRGKPIPHHSSTLTDFSNHHQNPFRSFRNGFCYQNQYSAYPALLPLPSPPPLQLPPLLQNHFIRNNTHFNKVPWKHKPSRPASSDNTHVPVSTLPQGNPISSLCVYLSLYGVFATICQKCFLCFGFLLLCFTWVGLCSHC